MSAHNYALDSKIDVDAETRITKEANKMYLARLPEGITRFRGFVPAPVTDPDDYPVVKHYASIMAEVWEKYPEVERAVALSLYGKPKSVAYVPTQQ